MPEIDYQAVRRILIGAFLKEKAIVCQHPFEFFNPSKSSQLLQAVKRDDIAIPRQIDQLIHNPRLQFRYCCEIPHHHCPKDYTRLKALQIHWNHLVRLQFLLRTLS